MKRSVFLFLSMIIIFHLNSISQEYVQFGAKGKYYLYDFETNLKIDSSVLGYYNNLNTNLVHQVPLNKYVFGEEYKLFIGLAIFDSPESIIEYYKISDDYKIIKSEQQKIKKNIYYKLLCKNDEIYNYRIIFRTKKSKYTVVFNYLSTDNNLLESFFDNPNFIPEKFSKKK